MYVKFHFKLYVNIALTTLIKQQWPPHEVENGELVVTVIKSMDER